MLKALELHGFKSFADKTRFEFPDGITVVVGPNGSGKSNVVDGIRWVLGEQSAKSLRGAEMADVIFKGSGTGQRKPANTAEVTIVFDNSAKLLDVESETVRVTRRVYRSGEGEYLINDEPCRLRDIRDLFRGTGVGTDAYSLIEQGKVDTLLQASPRERRAIFEEAAGISRFKAKKVESQRRLDRVEQNLLRLSDIVEEVERRLKSLRNQATKARRYKEYTDRLKELRTHVSLTDYREISRDCDALDNQLQSLTAQINTLVDENRDVEQESSQLDARSLELQHLAREIDQSLAQHRETIASQETTMQLHRKTLLELEMDCDRCRRRLVAVNSRAGDTQVQLKQVQQELATIEQEQQQVHHRAKSDETHMNELAEALRARQTTVQQKRQHHAEKLQTTAHLTTQLNRLESELDYAASTITRDQQRSQQLEEQLIEARRKQAQLDAREGELRTKLDEATIELDKTQIEFDDASSEVSALQAELAETQQKLTIATERAKVLEEVERKLEGISSGTKDLLAQARSDVAGPLSEVRGMVADLVEVQVDMAPVIDAALGERSQFIVVAGQRAIRAVASHAITLRGRVGFVSLSSLPTGQPAGPALANEEGVICRATEVVKADAVWKELVRFLLGSTWIVKSLEVGLRLREECTTSSSMPRFVTLRGEVLEPDGALLLGPRQHASGIVSRRSELRSLRSQTQQLTGDTSVLMRRVTSRREAAAECEQRLRKWTLVRKETSDAFASAHAGAEAARQMLAQTQAAQEALQAGISQLQSQQTALANKQSEAISGLAELEDLVSTLELELHEHQAHIAELESKRKQTEEQSTATRISLARIDHRVETLRVQALRCEQDNDERLRAAQELQQQLEQARRRHCETTREILAATSSIAEQYLSQEADRRQLEAFLAEQQQLQRDREDRIDKAKSGRQKAVLLEQSRHDVQMQLGELRLKRDSLAERVRDDYGIELAAIEDELSEQGHRVEIDQEILDLRRKISNIGAVNMESLAELEDLEERFGGLSSQYEDLIQAKESLERIIHRINADSRRMFQETLDAIRDSFQLLFRRAFGGGQADIAVEDDTDILDSGIEIVATPPGKHSLNISLLSGGERALTAVTLLLAIFRHRPSPFCVLDEVDGPLDEANIGRFVDVLKEFLDRTKIVIVTHSKKTMSASSTLYGVTMQESGVSKRVSVQFNDVSEDGTIREPGEADATRSADSNDGEAA